ncbi:MAG TPA: hypothetical protein DEA96_09215, partial [Leptospiraceae bacterium]|nr:hypothetical protein [Leptospiraceae bacterium]
MTQNLGPSTGPEHLKRIRIERPGLGRVVAEKKQKYSKMSRQICASFHHSVRSYKEKNLTLPSDNFWFQMQRFQGWLMQFQELISRTFFKGDMWIVSVAFSLALLLLILLTIFGLVRLIRSSRRASRKVAPPGVRRTEEAARSVTGSTDSDTPADIAADSEKGEKRSGALGTGPENGATGSRESDSRGNLSGPASNKEVSNRKASVAKESVVPAVESFEDTQEQDYSWIQDAEIRPVAGGEPVQSESGFAARDSSGWEDQVHTIPAAWREDPVVTGGTQKEPMAPILDLKSQMVDAALVSIPEYPLPIGQNLSSARDLTGPAANMAAISREDGLFDVYRNVSFLRSHLRSGLDPAELFFAGMGGDVAVNSHPYVLFLPEFAHDPEIRRKTESILQTAASGYMQRGLDRLASVEKEAVAWTIRFLFWKGRLDKAMSLVYRFSVSAESDLGRIRSLLAACIEDSLLSRVYPVSDAESAGYDRALLGIPSGRMSGFRSSLALQGITETEDFESLRPFTELDRRNARWFYLHLLHRGHLFLAFRFCHNLSRIDATFEEEALYLAGLQGRYRLMLRLLLELPPRNSFFRLAALKHGLAHLSQEAGTRYLEKLHKHWPEASKEALESVEPFAEFQGADTMRRSPGNILSSVANPLDRSELLDWLDLAAYRSRSG